MAEARTRPSLMDRTRAAACYANTHNDAGTDLAAFMALFHPEHPPESTRRMVNDARGDQRGSR